MSEIYYFGCINRAGHSLFASQDGYAISAIRPEPEFLERFGHYGARLDAMFAPPRSWPTQIYMVSTLPPWTIISWWDNSVDSRSGSHSTFVGKFVGDDEQLLKEAKEMFPEVFKRQPEIRKGVHIFK